MLITANQAPVTLEIHVPISKVTKSQMDYLCLENQSGQVILQDDKQGFTQLIRGLDLFLSLCLQASLLSNWQ